MLFRELAEKILKCVEESLTTTPAINLQDVSIIRGGREILRDVNLTINTGEHWIFLGPNGCGKTSLLRICAAQGFPSAGTVSILGMTLGKVHVDDIRPHIGIVQPNHDIQWPMTALDVVLTGITNTLEVTMRWQPTEADKIRSHQLLESVWSDYLAGTSWHALSHGERTRVLFARALISDRKLLLFDEPSTGLDLAARERLLGRIEDLAVQNRDVTTVTVTHHLEEIPASATHCAVFVGTQLISGPIEKVLNSENISESFDFPLKVFRDGNRWGARRSQA